jgi:DNA-binding response OmpR family regulator
MRILLVEDDPDTLRLMRRMLGMNGCQVECADTLIGARDLLSTISFDAVVSDLTLPDGSALTLFDGIPNIPCAIAITGWDNQEEVLRAGFRFHIQKPVNFRTLESYLSACRPDVGRA